MSKKYRVTLLVDATTIVEVEAKSKKEAMEKAMEEADRPCLCHQCSDRVDTGDIIKAIEAYEVEH